MSRGSYAQANGVGREREDALVPDDCCLSFSPVQVTKGVGRGLFCPRFGRNKSCLIFVRSGCVEFPAKAVPSASCCIDNDSCSIGQTSCPADSQPLLFAGPPMCYNNPRKRHTFLINISASRVEVHTSCGHAGVL